MSARFALTLAMLLLQAASLPRAAARISGEAPVTAATEIGRLREVAYRIDVPADWNRSLVVFFHGYAITPVTFEEGERISPMFEACSRAASR
jgi:poly(3-hydroxybutyrate) depolymerase